MSTVAIAVEGFIARELEVRNAGNHRVIDVTVPHTPSKKVDGQWVNQDDKTVWFEATFWDEHADALLVSVQKGSLVSLTGSVELEVYKRSNGEPGAKIKVTNPTIAAVVRRPKKGQSQPSPEQSWAPSEPATGGDVWNTPGSYSDETPF